MCSKLLLCECKQSEKGGKRILLDDNTDGEAVMCVGVWISTGLPCTR
jgi:hypothetical protein